jgi:hypothetical protein
MAFSMALKIFVSSYLTVVDDRPNGATHDRPNGTTF